MKLTKITLEMAKAMEIPIFYSMYDHEDMKIIETCRYKNGIFQWLDTSDNDEWSNFAIDEVGLNDPESSYKGIQKYQRYYNTTFYILEK